MSLRNIVRKTGINAYGCFPQCFGVINALLGMTTMACSNFPKSLNEFGYDFDADGRLKKLNTETGLLINEGFEFNVSENPQYNQKRYEALGEVINEHVYNLLEKEGLNRLPLPKQSSVTIDKRSFIFASNDALENEKILILIHGSGVVRAGQWARRLIINDSLFTGTQIPYIRKAKDLGYGLFVLNTNDNIRIIKGKPNKIKGSGDPHEHLKTVWNDYIGPSNSKYVAVVAHSYGGECIVKFAIDHAEEFKRKVFAVGLTDSVHIVPSKGFEHVVKGDDLTICGLPIDKSSAWFSLLAFYVTEWYFSFSFHSISKNWVCSDKPLDTSVLCPSGDIERVSAGHTVHEMSSSSCIDSLFRFIEDRYRNIHDTTKA
ncbi:FAM172 family protein homolog CG10038 isoform X1 [Vespa crabro]|uniref:FAM172 family protein homolog CG10038 isoform X1 n=1 Tax=Vespa crabro TaxID=7445 RepID=UPI001F02420E|nr:FAM172 family protein homolog CG10038 isoform X1 [Vespa crabro]XP_046814907.1 FAM172 family protein homolog CG10038 isoform X1 [Vespa crabro]